MFGLFGRRGRTADPWKPASADGAGRSLYDENCITRLCAAQLNSLEATVPIGLPAELNISEPGLRLELQLAMEAIPEAIAERMLREFGLPKFHGYVVEDERKTGRQFDLHEHPMFVPLMQALDKEIIPTETVRALAKSSAYADAAARARNADDSLAGATVVFVLLGLGLRDEKLHIKG